jgi:hypothetical protein
MTDDNENTPTKEQIADPEEIVQSRRLKSIFDIRDDLRKHRKTILMEKYDNAGVSRFEALCGYRALCNDYLMELEPLLNEYESGTQLLEERDFGYAYIQPTYEIISSRNEYGFGTEVKIHHKNGAETTAHGKPPTKKIRLEGLESVWTVPDPLVAQIDVAQSSDSLRDSKPVTIKDQFAVRTTDQFIRSMNMFLSDIGFELEPETEEDPANLSV